METDREPTIFKWQVLPFRTTCSPCCAILKLRYHVQKHTEAVEDACWTVERHFYVDNCLQRFPSKVHSNIPNVVSHLPADTQSENSIISTLFSQVSADPQELTLGLVWYCKSDTLCYKHCQNSDVEPTFFTGYMLNSTILLASISHLPPEPRSLYNISGIKKEYGMILNYRKICSRHGVCGRVN